MAAKQPKKAPGGGLTDVFTAIEALTFREMAQLAQLLHLQAEDNAPASAADFAQLLADAADSFFEAETN